MKMQKRSDINIINQNLKAISTLLGNIIMNLIIGNSLMWLYLSEKTNLNIKSRPNQNINAIASINKSKNIVLSLIFTFSNITKLNFTIYTRYSNIRYYIIFSLLPIIISHSLLYMFQIKFTSIIAFVIYGIGIGFPYHQLIINTNLHFINKKFYILLINKFCYYISPLLYLLFFQKYGNDIFPTGSEIIIFYLFLMAICSIMSFDYLRECRTEKIESNEQSMLIKNELEYSISDMTGTTERGSGISENSINLEKKDKIFVSENENINRVFISKRQTIIAVFNNKNIYLIILFFFSANFLTFEKIYMIKSDDIFFFLLILLISNIVMYIIFSKTQVPSIILRLVPLFVHILIIIYHTFNSKKEGFPKKVELFLVSLSYSLQYNIPMPLLKKIYGEKNAVFFSSVLVTLSTLSRWIFIFVNSVRNSLRILFVVFMIVLLLFINTDAFNFNENNKRKNLGHNHLAEQARKDPRNAGVVSECVEI